MSPTEDDPRKYWVGFNMVKGIGPVRFRELLDVFGDLQTAWKASRAELEAIGLPSRLIETMQQFKNSGQLEEVWTSILEKGIQVLTWEDETYPRRLRDIEQSPPVLYMLGELHDEDRWAVAIVGTRRVTQYGRQVTREVASQLAQAGITVVSGLARGVDAVAHQAALQSGGRSIAIMGCGVDIIYPPEHRQLASEIVQHGALLSDYPPGTPPDAVNFPPRNRIISGIAHAVLIVEAGERSGALITAAFAAEQGREVFAVPGNIYAPQSRGTNNLIRQGANVFCDVQDLIESLNLTLVAEHRAAQKALPSNPDEARLFAVLSQEPLHVDEIRAKVDMPIAQVAATLSIMELKGLVKQVGAMRYIAVYERGLEYQVDASFDSHDG